MSNQPNGKSTKIFIFAESYQAKHAIGVGHFKRKQFQNRPGILSLQMLGQQTNSGYITHSVGMGGKYKIYEKQRDTCYGFKISGSPDAVDNLMVQIQNWLEHCEQLYQNNYGLGFQ